MKKIIGLIALAFLSFSLPTEKKLTKTGIITFEASMPSFEEVKAKNENVTCILNTTSGEIAALALMKGFRFKIALMEEHFNENYVESDTYPKATFKGKIENFDLNKLSGTKEYVLKGKLEMHGKTNEIATKATLKKTNEILNLTSNFVVNIEDYNIKIPSVVSKKLSKQAKISLIFDLK